MPAPMTFSNTVLIRVWPCASIPLPVARRVYREDNVVPTQWLEESLEASVLVPSTSFRRPPLIGGTSNLPLSVDPP